MMSGSEIRQHVREGLASGKLWRLRRDHGTLDNATTGAPCHVCEQAIPRGQAYKVARATITVLVHLECYLCWLHASGLFEAEPITCASCGRLIPPHAEKTVIQGEPHHTRCWERVQDRIQGRTCKRRPEHCPRAHPGQGLEPGQDGEVTVRWRQKDEIEFPVAVALNAQ